jgi:hypothetical protein
MYIDLCSSFTRLSDDEIARYHGIIENLIIAHAEGWHVFAPDRGVIRYLLPKLSLSRSQSEILLAHIMPRISTLRGSALSADFRVVVTPDNMQNLSNIDRGIRVAASRFSTVNNCRNVRLIVEDSNSDGEYMRAICNALKNVIGINAPISFEIVHGGGSRLAARFREEASIGWCVVCVSDSDRRVPDADLRGNPRVIHEIGRLANSPLVKAIILPVREIENMIPLMYIDHVYKNDPSIIGRVSVLRSIQETDLAIGKRGSASYLAVHDMKEGLTAKDFKNLPVAAIDYFESVVGIYRSGFRRQDVNSMGDGEMLIPGVSSRLINNCIDHLNSGGSMAVFIEKAQECKLWPKVQEIVREIVFWSACARRIPVNLQTP